MALAPVRLGHRVSSQPLRGVEGVRHGLHAGGVDLAHLFDQPKHPVQPLEDRSGFLGADGKAGEAREAPHLVVI